MSKDYSEDVKKSLKEFEDRGFEFGKPIELLVFKSGFSEEKIIKEIFNFDFLKFTEKQDKDGEIRYVLYFVYSRKRGSAFVITFREKIRIITIYPLGYSTLKKYYKRKFKKGRGL